MKLIEELRRAKKSIRSPENEIKRLGKNLFKVIYKIFANEACGSLVMLRGLCVFCQLEWFAGFPSN